MSRKAARNLLVVVAIILFIASAIFFVSGRSIKNKDKIFMNSCTETTGKIIGYRQIDQGNDVPKVSFVADGKEVVSEGKGTNLTPKTHPEGTQVRIAYIPVEIMGIAGFDVRIINRDGTMPASKNSVTVVTVISGVLLTLALILAKITLRANARF